MKNLDQKAEEYIEPFRTSLLGCETDLMKEAYIAGATEALASQWRSVEDELPPEDAMVLCRMKSNDAIVSGYITHNQNGTPIVATNPDFHFEDYGGYECSDWMPITEPPKPDNHA